VLTIGLIIAGLLILGGVLLALGMLGALWFGTSAFPPPEEGGGPGSGDPGPPGSF